MVESRCTIKTTPNNVRFFGVGFSYSYICCIIVTPEHSVILNREFEPWLDHTIPIESINNYAFKHVHHIFNIKWCRKTIYAPLGLLTNKSCNQNLNYGKKNSW